MKKYITLSIVALSAALWSCGGKDHEHFVDESTAIAVQVKRVIASTNRPSVSVSGQIEAVNRTRLSTRMMGHVDLIKVKIGDRVRKGDLLLTINNRELLAKRAQVNASITEASAALKIAKKDFERFQALFARESATRKELDDRTAHYEMAKARLEGAEQMKKEVDAQFAYTNLRAPFSGTITRLLIDEGDLAKPGLPLMELEAPGEFEAVVRVPESEITHIATDSSVQVYIKTLKTTVLADVSEVSSSASSTGGQYIVKAHLRATEVPILSGMFVTVAFPYKSADEENLVMVPRTAIIERGQLSGIYTVSQSSTAILRWLRLGRNYDDQVEVLSGLSPGESYIHSAQAKLYNGAKISIQ